MAPDVGVIQLRLPDPFVDKTYPAVPPVIITLLFEPRLLTPDTLREVRVPTEVIFGCAAVVSVPVI